MKLWKYIWDVFYNIGLNMLYSCTKPIQPLTARAIKLLMHIVLTHPTAARFTFTGAQTQRGCTGPWPGSSPRNCFHCAGSTQGTLLISAGFSYMAISEMLPAMDFRTSRVNRLNHAKGIMKQAAHGGPGCSRATETQDSSGLFQQLQAEGIPCLRAPGGLQIPDQKWGRQWQILHFNALKSGRIYFAWKYT